VGLIGSTCTALPGGAIVGLDAELGLRKVTLRGEVGVEDDVARREGHCEQAVEPRSDHDHLQR